MVAYLDDDVVVDRCWFEGLQEAWRENEDASAFTGLVMPLELGSRAQILFERREGFRHGSGRSQASRTQQLIALSAQCSLLSERRSPIHSKSIEAQNPECAADAERVLLSVLHLRNQDELVVLVNAHEQRVEFVRSWDVTANDELLFHVRAELDPCARSLAGFVGGIDSFSDDAFQTEFAHRLKNLS
jgi:hypothetical protein